MKSGTISMLGIATVLAACSAAEDDGQTGTLQAKLASGLEVGDAMGDGTVDIVDALAIAQKAGGGDPQPFFEDAADANCDGGTDVVDVVKFVNVVFRDGGPATEFCDPCAL